jgi:hypothetical protein
LDKFEAIDEARKILGLGEEASREEVKGRYKKLMKKYHPDKTPNNQQYLEKSKTITWAYSIIASYCNDYKFSFRREDVESMNPDLKLRKQFDDDWLTKGK